MKTETETEIKADKFIRRDLDGILQSLKSLAPSRERNIAITKLQESIMWLGQDLARLGAANPYPESKNPESSVVKPAADKAPDIAAAMLASEICQEIENLPASEQQTKVSLMASHLAQKLREPKS